MKRSPLKRGKAPNKTSAKMDLIIKCEDLMRASLIKERGNFCQLSGRPANGLGLFHILPKGEYPRVRLHPYNLLLVNWLPYHYWWHHDCYKKEMIEELIRKAIGKNYLTELKTINATAPKMDMFRLNLIYESLKQDSDMV